MKTLQQQYLLIKEGKGNKEQFLKHARYLFPEYITVNNDYNTTTSILKGKGILTEAVGGIATLNPNHKPDWFKIFDTNLREAVGVKDKEEYGDQNKFEASKETEETLKKANFDNADPKNIDNLYGQSFLLGYLTEMWDEKNADKTVGELKDIVAKNMAKDINYYHTEASFGVKGIGYKKDVVGGGEPVAPKGKYKSSGYGDMPKKTVKEGLNEGKRPSIEAEIKEIEKSNEALALEAKIKKIEEAIKARESKLQVAESEELAEMINPAMVKTLKQEIKKLEGYKAKAQKMHEKMTKTKSKEVIKDEEITEIFGLGKKDKETEKTYEYSVWDNDEKVEVNFSTKEEAEDYINKNPETRKMRKMNENSYYDSDPTDGDADFDMGEMAKAEELYDKGLQAYSEGDLLKAQQYYKDALRAGSWLGWTENDLPPYETL